MVTVCYGGQDPSVIIVNGIKDVDGEMLTHENAIPWLSKVHPKAPTCSMVTNIIGVMTNQAMYLSLCPSLRVLQQEFINTFSSDVRGSARIFLSSINKY